jgi:tetratricopeptide (TPR) repeat protein
MIVTEAELDAKQQNLWKRGLIAIEQKNWEYAVNMLLPVVKEVPGFLDGRKALRRAEGEISGGGKKFSLGGGMFGGGGKKDPLEAIADLEEKVFQKDPFSESGNKQLYDLALKLQFVELASFALETTRMGQPNNTKLLHQLALHYITYEQPDKASEVYAAIVKLDPRDMLANKGYKDSAARSSIRNQGYDKGFQESKKNSDEQNILELLEKKGKTREQTESLLAHFSAKYNEEPSNINHVKAIAQLYEELEDLTNAVSFYDYALTLNPSDISLQRKTELLRDKSQDQYIAQVEAWLAANPDAPEAPEQRQNLINIKQQRASSSISEAKARVDRNPTDKGIRFDLGQAYFNAGMFTEAIPELQQAKGNPHIRIKAMLLLGRCFERKNMNDLSRSAFMEANKELTIMDNTKKEVLYELAQVCEKMGDKVNSLEALKEIYNADYGYKDVAVRVESSYSS